MRYHVSTDISERSNPYVNIAMRIALTDFPSFATKCMQWHGRSPLMLITDSGRYARPVKKLFFMLYLLFVLVDE